MLGKRHIPKDYDIEDIKRLETHASALRDVYVSIMQEDVDDIQYIKIADFENPNWMYERAFKDGMLSAYQKMIEIIGE